MTGGALQVTGPPKKGLTMPVWQSGFQGSADAVCGLSEISWRESGKSQRSGPPWRP